VENFYPAELEADIEPHGIIYAVKDVKGREPRAYYNPESHTAFFFNSAYYAQLRSLALGIVADISEKLYNALAVHAACFDIDGQGTLVFFPPATGKSTHLAGLLKHGPAKIVSPDLVMMRVGGAVPTADCIERKFYMRTDFVEKYPAAAGLFERSRCENVVINKDQCENQECMMGEECALDKGELFCFIGSSKSRAMLDPYWLGGPDKHTKRAQLRNVLIFKNDGFGKIAEELSADKALQVLEEGRPAAAAVSEKSYPFYNPYVLVRTTDRTEQQKRFYRRLLEKTRAYSINIGAGAPKDVQKAIIEITAGKGREVLR
jgi:hypothetical protein